MGLGSRRQKEIPTDEKAIEISAQMQGSLTFKDPVSLKINGDFSGTLDTKGSLTIGETANVTANINGDNIVIAGRVTGDIVAETMLVLMPTAALYGNIRTPKLNIVEGAIFQGTCQMGPGDGLLDLNEVSNYLEISMKEIEELANSGKIPGTKEGKSWKFEKDKIDLWASSSTAK